jgi:hypothetical protein
MGAGGGSAGGAGAGSEEVGADWPQPEKSNGSRRERMRRTALSARLTGWLGCGAVGGRVGIMADPLPAEQFFLFCGDVVEALDDFLGDVTWDERGKYQDAVGNAVRDAWGGEPCGAGGVFGTEMGEDDDLTAGIGAGDIFEGHAAVVVEGDAEGESAVGSIEDLGFVDAAFIEEERAFDEDGDAGDLDGFAQGGFARACGEMESECAGKLAGAGFVGGAAA